MSQQRKTAKTPSGKQSFFAKHSRGFVLCGAFLLPVIIFMIVLFIQGFYPFGSKTTIFMDLKDQYMEFAASLRYSGDSGLLFNWSRSMGGNALGLYAYYMGGILTYITCLFPISHIYAGILFLQVIKIGLCGLTFGVFLEFGPFEKKRALRTILFSTAYALMSYNIVYISCFMWLTGCIFLPLCMLGIEKIIQGRRGLLLYICLSGAMIENYYTAYMICLFSIMYFVFRIVGEYNWTGGEFKKTLKKAGMSLMKYACCGVGAALTALPVLIPVYTDLMSGKLSSGGSNVSGTNFEFSSVFYKLLPGQYDSITDVGPLPSIYTGIICLLFVCMFFFSRKIKYKEKIIALSILITLLICFWKKVPDCFWHGMQKPNWFPYRYAFVFCFFMVYMAARSYDGWSHMIKANKIRNIVTAGLIVVLSVELCYNANVVMKKTGELEAASGPITYMDSQEYDSFINETEPLINDIKSSDSSMYRIGKDYEFSKNDAMLLGYNGMTHYSSTYNAGVNNITSRLGLAQSWFWNSGYGATPVADSLFGVKYRLAEKTLASTYLEKESNDKATLYENPNVLPVVFSADEGCTGLNELVYDVFSNQNLVMRTLTGQDSDIFSFYNFVRQDNPGESLLSFQAVNDNPVYLYMLWTDGMFGEIYVNDKYVNNYFTTESTCAVYLGEFSPGETVNVSVRTDSAAFDSAWITSMDRNLYEEQIGILGTGNFTEEKHGAGSLSGTINVGDGQVIATTIPYDDGFDVKIDGKNVNYTKWLDTFIAIPAAKGSHQIEISFSPVGFMPGLIASIVTIITVIAIGVICLLRDKRKEGVA